MTEPETVEIRLLDVPVDVQARSAAHLDALQREFELIAREHSGADHTPARLRRLIADLKSRFDGIGTGPAEELQRARAEGRDRVSLTYTAPVGVGEASRRLDEMLAEADEYCRDGQLMTLATPPELVAFRQWFLGEFIRQAEGEPPRSWDIVAPTEATEPAEAPREVADTGPDGWNLRADQDRAVISFAGELDLESAPYLRTLVTDVCREPLSALEIDLRDVTFIDSVGLSVLLTVRLRLTADGVDVTVRASDAVNRVFQISGVDELFAS